jgi:hypothetical protein
MSRVTVVLVACVAVTALIAAPGCKKHNGGKGVGGGKSGDPAAIPSGPGIVQILLDGKPVAGVGAEAAAKWAPITDLLPGTGKDAKTWQALEIHTAAGRVTTMPEPGATQPGLVAAIFPGKDGVDFGMFTPDELARHGTPKLVETNVTDVRVKLGAAPAAPAGSGSGSSGSHGGGDGEGSGANRTASGGSGPDLSGLKLTIKQKSGDVEVTGDDLGKIDRVVPPIGDTETQGWDVAAVLASRKLKPTAKVVITDESGTTVTMTAAQFDPKKDLAFMKVNKQGQIRFRLFEKNAAGAWDVAGELRGVTTIELLP